LNKNIKTITTNNKRWDVLASPFYHFFMGQLWKLIGFEPWENHGTLMTNMDFPMDQHG
jgi:hypothetical protein